MSGRHGSGRGRRAESWWLSEVQPLIDAGLVRVDWCAARFFGRVAARFPLGSSNIDWSKVPGAALGAASHRAGPSDDWSAATLVTDWPAVAKFLGQVAAWAEADLQEQFVLIGDMEDVAFRLTMPTLQAHAEGFLGQRHQHYFLLPPVDARWCFSYTMLGEAWFGWAVWEEGHAPRRRPSRDP